MSLSGTLTGSGVVAKTQGAVAVLDALDIIASLLLILGEIDVIRTYATANRFTVVVGGPPFGLQKVEGCSPRARQFFDDYSHAVLRKYESSIGRKR